ncbi:MAG: YceD family protein [Bacteroidales bacterium]|jgi:uncharacterized metal-binding protein YceD (DUF177 family)|nr:YceD family protein [Bacteroidales bacterium]
MSGLLKDSKAIRVPVGALAPGKHNYQFGIGGAFFGNFENSEIFDADLVANVEVEKGRGWMNVKCNVKGSVAVECDRCLERVDVPENFTADIAIKFTGDEVGNGDDFITANPDTDSIDLSQLIYDYACMNLPLQRVHKDGECNPQMIKYISKDSIDASGGTDEEKKNLPFEALKDLLKKK